MQAGSPPPSGGGAMSPSSSQSYGNPPKRPKIEPAASPSFTGSPMAYSPQAYEQPIASPVILSGNAPQGTISSSLAMPPPASTTSISKPVDTNDLQDVVASSGIDLRAEELELSNNNSSSTSFNPDGSYSGYDFKNYPKLSQEGMYNRANASNTPKANHAVDPFLKPSMLRERLVKKLQEFQMKQQLLPDITRADGHSTGMNQLEATISIAMQTRVRDLLSVAANLARYRRDGNTVGGMGEWADMAIGESEPADRRDNPMGESMGASMSMGMSMGMSMDAESPSSSSNPRKRSFSVANANNASTNPAGTPPLPRKPKLISETARTLRRMAEVERAQEEARIAARQHRINNPNATTSNPATPSDGPAPGSVAPEPEAINPNKKLTAKETRKANQAKIEEATSHRAANATAQMMLGGGRKKKYDWMNAGGKGGGPAAPGNTSAGPSRAGTPTIAVKTPVTQYWGKRMGQWNEQGESGKNIQLRDWVSSLESDGRDKKAIIKGHLKMK